MGIIEVVQPRLTKNRTKALFDSSKGQEFTVNEDTTEINLLPLPCRRLYQIRKRSGKELRRGRACRMGFSGTLPFSGDEVASRTVCCDLSPCAEFRISRGNRVLGQVELMSENSDGWKTNSCGKGARRYFSKDCVDDDPGRRLA